MIDIEFENLLNIFVPNIEFMIILILHAYIISMNTQKSMNARDFYRNFVLNE